jgi:aminoglycoside phosphotransferase (APT) family kinase protein
MSSGLKKESKQDVPQITDVRSVHQFDVSALERYLSTHLDGFEPPLSVQQFEGGQSNPTFLLTARDSQWVLRKKPPGNLLPSAHQVDREFRVMHALQGTDVPVPQTALLCEDTSVLGTEFFIMEMVHGRVIVDPLESELEPDHRRELYLDFIRVLAHLHQVDHEAVGLKDFGRPGNYFSRQIARWSRQYQASRTDDIREMELLMSWLPKHVPDDDTSSIVHGDYSIKNCVVHSSEPKILAVLDWELSTIGHPFGDLSYLCQMYYANARSEDEMRRMGVPSQQEVVAHYCGISGRPGIEDWSFYMAYSLFRSAAIVQGVVKRGLDGNAASNMSLSYQPLIRTAAEAGWALISGK